MPVKSDPSGPYIAEIEPFLAHSLENAIPWCYGQPMAILSFLEKLRPYKSVVRRTRAKADLPEELLYADWLGGEGSRKMIDLQGNEHVITDKVLQSNYKLATGAYAKKLIKEHWADANPKSPKN
jgi:hypothetical protein